MWQHPHIFGSTLLTQPPTMAFVAGMPQQKLSSPFHIYFLLLILTLSPQLVVAAAPFRRGVTTIRQLPNVEDQLRLQTEQLVQLRQKYKKLQSKLRVEALEELRKANAERDHLRQTTVALEQALEQLRTEQANDRAVAVQENDTLWNQRLEDSLEQHEEQLQKQVQTLQELQIRLFETEQELAITKTNAQEELAAMQRSASKDVENLRIKMEEERKISEDELRASFEAKLKAAMKRASARSHKYRKQEVEKAVAEQKVVAEAELEELRGRLTAEIEAERQRGAEAVEHEKVRMRKLVQALENIEQQPKSAQ